MQHLRTIVLASTSPRRQELLKKIGLNFLVEFADIEEKLDRDLAPAKLAETISLEKARAVAPRYPDAIIIAADTFGVLQGKILGKPTSPEAARQMIREMSGRSHLVITGFTVLDTRTGRTITRSVETKVYFKKLRAEEINSYVNSGEPLDKAGAYAIQGLGAVIVKKIVGDYYNVMGLPLSALTESLNEFDIHIL